MSSILKKTTVLLIGLFTFACASYKTVFQNHDPNMPNSQSALITAQGMQLYLEGAPKKLVDHLSLSEGEYIIRFRQVSSHMSGAARCVVQGGKLYQLKISGRSFLKTSKNWILTGNCEVVQVTQ